MDCEDVFAPFEVSDGAADSQDLVVGSGRKTHFFHGVLQKSFCFRVELAELANLAGLHATVETLLGPDKTAVLGSPGSDHFLTHFLTTRAGLLVREFTKGNGR